MVAEVGRRKALAQVLERAVVKDESGNEIDLASLFPASEEDVLEDGVIEGEIEEAHDHDHEGHDHEHGHGHGHGPAAGDPTALPSF
jgi:ABC-type Zn2+ transport system substrate-binding protein/surface adhesin